MGAKYPRGNLRLRLLSYVYFILAVTFTGLLSDWKTNKKCNQCYSLIVYRMGLKQKAVQLISSPVV